MFIDIKIKPNFARNSAIKPVSFYLYKGKDMNTVVDSLNGGWNYIESPFKHFSGLNIEVFYAHLLTNISLVFMHKYLLTSISLEKW